MCVQAIPILNDALSALDTIKEADIVYIKKLANPPPAIKLVLKAVCVVLDIKPNKVSCQAQLAHPQAHLQAVVGLVRRLWLQCCRVWVLSLWSVA